MSHHDDFEVEHAPGIPAPLPGGEHIVWQGKPETAALARSALHTRKIAIYFLILMAWRLGAGVYDGKASAEIVTSVSMVLVMAVAALAILYGIAWLMHRTTVYTLTNKRILMRFGIALPVTFNLPFSQITSADVKSLSTNTGNIALTLAEHTKISWPVLWPHVRPWKIAKPQPTLRAIGDVAKVSKLVAQELRAAHNQTFVQPAGIAVPADTAPTATPVPSMQMKGA